MDALDRFAELAVRPDPPLDEALALVAAHGRRDVRVDDLVAALDALAAELGGHVGGAVDAGSLCSTLFGPGGFRGDGEDYHDPRNSLLDQVLERRLGIPITLSVLAMEVGRRLGVELVGIGMPGHFLVRDAHDAGAFHDPFHGGAPLDVAGCRSLFERLHGSRARFEAGMLEPTGPAAILTRVLANLRYSYLLESSRAGLLRVAQLQAAMPGAGLAERRALAQLLAADGRFDEAARLHRELSGEDPDPDQDHESRAIQLLARLN